MKMKKPKSPKVPVLEDALELNLPKLRHVSKAAGSGRLVLDDGNVRTIVLLSETRLAAFLGGRAWVADIVAVACLGDRLRPLLKCPRAHEGNFQSLYFANDVLACRHCHALRYRSNLAANVAQRFSLKRTKMLAELSGGPGDTLSPRRSGRWRKKYLATAAAYVSLSNRHYDVLKTMMSKR
jgi:hypothetical protein